MIALRLCDSQRDLIPHDQETLRLSSFGGTPFPYRHSPCEGLPTAVILIYRASIMLALFMILHFNTKYDNCQPKFQFLALLKIGIYTSDI